MEGRTEFPFRTLIKLYRRKQLLTFAGHYVGDLT